MLAKFSTDIQELELLQTSWSTDLNPLIRNAALNGILLPKVALVVGDNTINHKLGRKLQGWMIVRLRAASTIYDKQDVSSIPNLTLTLNASAAVVVDLYVF